MLSLKSEKWSELQHAYGSATDIPALLQKLQDLPVSDDDAEPWFTLWSALAHQGDVYSASFAAVPHVIDCLATSPAQADAAFLQFPAWVEICRAKNNIEVPPDLQIAYAESLARLPALAVQALHGQLDPGRLACALSAIAAANGQHAMAEAALEISSPQIAEEFLEWHFSS